MSKNMEDQDETLPFEISTDLNACGTEMSSRVIQIIGARLSN